MYTDFHNDDNHGIAAARHGFENFKTLPHVSILSSSDLTSDLV
jgi:hypothetical protein